MIVTDAVLDANSAVWGRLSAADREECRQWIRQHGFDPRTVVTVELDCVDMPLLRVGHFEDTLEVVDGQIVLTYTDVAQRQMPPGFWQPRA